jgi:hypothetical protein
LVRRVKLFAKGNVDVYDSLHSSRIGGAVRWNGVNEALKVSHPGVTIRVRHETAPRSDAMAEASGQAPPEAAGIDRLLGSFPVASQFSTAMFTTDAEVIVLSILTDVLVSSLYRHRKLGFALLAGDCEVWPAADRAWLEREFVRQPRLEPEESMRHFERLIARIRGASEAPILIYNLSPIMPGDDVHCYAGLDETFPRRIRRFNNALADLSARTGISIVDVDRIIARAGADRTKLDIYHLTPEGYALVAAEVVRILDDLGVLDREPA